MKRRARRLATVCAMLTLTSACGDDVQSVERSRDSDHVASEQGSGGRLGDAAPGAPLDDSCHVDLSGDITAAYDSPGGTHQIVYGPWMPSSRTTIVAVRTDDSFFMMHCSDGNGLQVTFTVPAGQHLSMSPQLIPIREADNDFGGYGSDPPLIQVLPYIGAGDYMYAVSADSSFTIAAFDTTHIAGHFEVTVAEAKHTAMSDGLPPKTVTITGHFDLQNPN
ncbi:MAG: hypothetical protein WCC60_07565 [Ilumatobacteraceae bacterium]